MMFNHNIFIYLYRTLIWCSVGVFMFPTLAAQNLIKNPSFENYATNNPSWYLDTSLTNFDNILYWRSATFDRVLGLAGPFSSSITTVNPNSGDYHVFFSPGLNYESSSARTFIQGILTDTLKKNCFYSFSFYFQPRARLNPLPDADSLFCTNNRLGFYFSRNPISDTSGISLNNSAERRVQMLRHFDSLQITPQIAIPTDTFYTDTSKYTYYEQTFVAQGGEQYITMGNFYPIEQTLYKNLYTHEVFSTYLEDTTINQQSVWHIDDLNLQLVPQPGQAFTHSNDTVICPGESVTLFAQLDIPGTYLWSTGDTTSSIVVNESGTYEVQASCPCGIEYTAQIEVTVLDELPEITLPDTVFCERENKLQISLPKGLDYTLNGEPIQHKFDIFNEGVYELVAQNECEHTEHVFEVGIDACEPYVYMPNAFTPNNDGRNDCYSISAQHVHNFQVYIYNRWGAEVFSSNDPNFCWDGTVNGTPSAQDVYTCVILYSETPYSGLVRHTQTVTLIR